MSVAPETCVSCGRCGGNVFMATCHHFRGTGHEWVLASLCMVCRNVHWIEDGCPDCRAADRRVGGGDIIPIFDSNLNLLGENSQ